MTINHVEDMNVLLTCAGRRNYLVKYFQEALAGHGSVYGADASETSPALSEADGAFKVPDIYDPSYIDCLLSICKAYKIGLLLSLNDLELPILARERTRFLDIGTFPLVSDYHIVDLCFDKWEAEKFLKKINIDTPKSYLTLKDAVAAINNRELSFPVVVKPRWGTASLNIEYPQTVDELELTVKLCRMKIERSIIGKVSKTDLDHCLIIQEKLNGKEHGLDVINNLQGRHVTTFVKQKLGMRAGETDKASTVNNQLLSAIGKRIGQELGHIGNLDCDVFFDSTRACVLEMNPRFGGGYPFSHQAGAKIPAAIIAWATGKDPDEEWLTVRPNVIFSKCDRLVEIHKQTMVRKQGILADEARMNDYFPRGTAIFN